jgi:phenylacetic acid degradation operon negative regulatory protein
MIPTLDISLFHKILVLVEDRGEITLADLKAFGSTRQTLGALGRLEGLGYIERIKDEKDVFRFSLTEKGDASLATILERIPKPDQRWDYNWRMILFDIPESQRTVRQMFRLKLMDLGARMLQSSVWITPDATIISKFQRIINDLDFGHTVHFFEAKHVGDNVINIDSLWNLSDLAKEYKDLFKRFDKELNTLKRADDASFLAKCMIINLALVTKKDPHLPAELMPKNWIGYQTEAWYQKLRHYCN